MRTITIIEPHDLTNFTKTTDANNEIKIINLSGQVKLMDNNFVLDMSLKEFINALAKYVNLRIIFEEKKTF